MIKVENAALVLEDIGDMQFELSSPHNLIGQ